MGFYAALMQRLKRKFARAWGNGCAKAMLVTALAVKNQHNTYPTYAWVARKALLYRNHWIQLTETEFLFEKFGEPVTISDDMSLLEVIHLVIDV